MMPLRRFLLNLLFVTLLVVTLNTSPTRNAHAQTDEPTALIDSIFNDLSQRLGKTITRRNADNWDWTEDVYPDTSIGCPQPGQTYKSGSIRGYKVTITVQSVVYDYRAVKGNSAFIRCSPTDSTPVSPTAIPASTVVPNTQPTLQPTAISAPTVLPVTAAPTSQNLIAYIAADGNLHIRNLNTNNDSTITQDAQVKTALDSIQPDEPDTARRYANPRWSPDGTKLLYSEVKSGTLYVVTPGQQPTQLVTDLTTGNPYLMPAVWSPDGSEIAYDKGGNIFIVPASGGTPRQIFTINGGCGGAGDGNSDPAAVLYRRDNNISSSRSSAPALFWTPAGILFTPNGCTPWLMIDLTGKTLWKQEFAEVALSPDQKQLASFSFSGGEKEILQITDLATGKTTPTTLRVSGTVNLLGWTADSSAILYSLITFGENVFGAIDSTVGKKLFPANWPFPASSYLLSLWRLPLDGGRPTQLLARQGYRISRLVAFDTGIAFSLIASAAPMTKLINAGKSENEINAAVPRTELYFLEYGTLAYRRLTIGGQPAFNRVTVAPTTVQTPQVVNCPGAPLSRLVVGGQGRVLPGDPNDIRPAPGGVSIGQIPAGATFAVLEGPVCTRNGIAWWRVSYNGQTGWTAEGQGSTYFVEPA